MPFARHLIGQPVCSPEFGQLQAIAPGWRAWTFNGPTNLVTRMVVNETKRFSIAFTIVACVTRCPLEHSVNDTWLAYMRRLFYNTSCLSALSEGIKRTTEWHPSSLWTWSSVRISPEARPVAVGSSWCVAGSVLSARPWNRHCRHRTWTSRL